MADLFVYEDGSDLNTSQGPNSESVSVTVRSQFSPNYSYLESYSAENLTVNHSEEESASVRTCTACGGNNIILDTIHNSEQFVCQDCGCFLEEQELISYHEYATSTGKSINCYQWTRAPLPKFANGAPYIPPGKRSGVATVRDLSARLNFPSDLTEQAVALFENLYESKEIKGTSLVLKDTIGVCCVYAVARENRVDITIKSLNAIHKVNKKLFTRALRLMKDVRKKPLSHQKVSALHEHVLAVSKFSSGLLKKISNLVDVCEKGFVTQGRDHANVIIGVAHLAWMSEVIDERKSVTLKKFCSQHSLPYTRHCHILQNEIRELFKTLASQLPWLMTSVTSKNVLYYLDSITKFRQTVISEVYKKHPGTSKTSTVTHDLPALAPPSMRADCKKVKVTDPDEVLLPKHLSDNLDNEDLNATEFSDQEIAYYILSPEEVKLKQEVLTIR